MKHLRFATTTLTAFIALSSFAQTGDPKLTEVWEPVPTVVTPGEATKPPSDAIVLFSGNDLSAWQSANDSSAPKWKVSSDYFTVEKGKGAITSKQSFGSCQLHIEWRTPSPAKGEGQDRGNSGIFFMGLYELQVLDSYNSRTYSNGQAGSIYKQGIPLVNACKKPGEWQVYDVVFNAPKFNSDGSLLTPADVTVFQNGILVQNHFILKGPTEYIGEPVYKVHADKLPFMLQDHGHPVSFRNIWVREL